MSDAPNLFDVHEVTWVLLLVIWFQYFILKMNIFSLILVLITVLLNILHQLNGRLFEKCCLNFLGITYDRTFKNNHSVSISEILIEGFLYGLTLYSIVLMWATFITQDLTDPFIYSYFFLLISFVFRCFHHIPKRIQSIPKIKCVYPFILALILALILCMLILCIIILFLI